MEQELVDIILTKEFKDLKVQEKIELESWCSTEEEFYNLKSVFLEVENFKKSTISPRKETKESLDQMFKQQHSKVLPVAWYNTVLVAMYPTDKPMRQRPLVQVAAIGLIILITIPFMTRFSNEKDGVQLAQREEISIEPKSSKADQTENNLSPIVNENSEGLSNEMNTNPMEYSPEVFVVDEETPSIAFVDADKIMVEESKAESLEEFEDIIGNVVFDHPDGVFTGASGVQYSKSAAEQPALFDLLTASF